MKLKKLLNESFGMGKLPSESMFKLNKETGKYEAPKKENIKEAYKSNITSKWKTSRDIESDLSNFIDDSYQASGEDLIKQLHEAFKRAVDYIESKNYENI